MMYTGYGKLISAMEAATQRDEFLNIYLLLLGRVYTELPTLNDVFLKLTGKELRD